MRPAWLAALLLTGLTLLVTWPLAPQMTRSLPGDYGDPVFVSWAIGWVAGQLTQTVSNPRALGEIWNANIFFPEAQTLAFSEHFIGQTLMVLPLYWLSGNLILLYNVAFIASFVLTGVGMFLLTRALTGSATAAMLAAAIAAFNPYRLAFEISHLHVLSIQWLPFALYALHRYFETDKRRYLAFSAFSLIALNLSSIYYTAYCAPFIVIFTVCEMLRTRRWSSPRVWLELWAAAAFVAVVTVPFLVPYMEVQRRLGIERTLAEVIGFSATIDQYKLAGPSLWPAVALSAVALFGFALDRTPLTRWTIGVSFVLTVLAFWLSLGPTIQSGGQPLDFPGIYRLLYDYVPGYKGLRVPARFAALLFIFAGVLAGAGVSVLERRFKTVARVVAIAALIVFVRAATPSPMPLNQPLPSPDLAPVPAYLTPSPDMPDIYRAVDSISDGAILIEFPFGDQWYDLRYMYFAATHRRRLLNGYSGIFPPSFIARQKVLARPSLDPTRAVQAIDSATHAVVHHAAWKDDNGALIGGWLQTLGAQLITEANGAALYELPTREQLATIGFRVRSPNPTITKSNRSIPKSPNQK